jgi:two-component sensor histidine kinase
MGLFRSVRGRVSTFFLIAGLPIFVIAGVGAVESYRAAQRQDTDKLRLAAEAVAGDIGQLVSGAEQTLIVLAQTLPGSIDPALCDSILARTLATARDRYTVIVLLDAQGTVRCSSHGEAARRTIYADAQSFREIVAGKSSVVGRFQRGRITGMPIVPIGVAAPRADGTTDVLVLGLSTAVLEQYGRRNTLREGFRAWLVDEVGTTLGLSDEARPDGLPDAATRARLMALDRAEATGRAGDGTPTRYIALNLRDDLGLIVAAPAGAWLDRADATLARRFAEIALLLLVTLAAVLVGLHLSVVRPLRSVSLRIRAWREGAGPFDPGDLTSAPEEVRDVALAYADATAALLEREKRMSQAVAQRDLIFAEIHHRVKNNLQIVASLLNLQAARTADPVVREEFQVAGERVRTLSTLHRHLYLHADPERIALVPFLTELCHHLFDSFGVRVGRGDPGIALAVEAPELAMPSDIVVPMALIVTEAVTNALKFAFPAGGGGQVRIAVAVKGNTVSLTVADDGIGRGNAVMTVVSGDEETAGLGMRLIEAFAAQLGGTLSITSGAAGRGTTLSVVFPLPGGDGREERARDQA